MMDFEKILKDAMFTTIGAAAAITEKSAEVVKALADKGAELLTNKEAAEQLTEKGRKVVDASGAAFEDFCKKVKEAVTTETFVINVADLTKEEREQLRQQLDRVDEEEAAAPAEDGAEEAEEVVEEVAAEAEAPVEECTAEEAVECTEADATVEACAECSAEAACAVEETADNAEDEPQYT